MVFLAAAVVLSSIATTPARAVEPARTDKILIRFAPGTTKAERRAIARDSSARSLATVRQQLADDPRVTAVAPNYRRELAEDVSAEPAFPKLWALNNTGQPISGTTNQTGTPDIDIDGLQALSLGIGRSDVVVAVIDDGVDFSHPDLADRAWTNPERVRPVPRPLS